MPPRGSSLPNPDAPPAQPALVASQQRLRDVLTPDYWRQICPELHVGTNAPVPQIQLPAQRMRDLRGQVNSAAVAQVGGAGGALRSHGPGCAAAGAHTGVRCLPCMHGNLAALLRLLETYPSALPP